jgi:hypothetical protein
MAAVSRLEASVARADQLIRQEQNGQGSVRPITKRKGKLRWKVKPSDSDGKVIPLRTDSPDDPDPAA